MSLAEVQLAEVPNEGEVRTSYGFLGAMVDEGMHEKVERGKMRKNKREKRLFLQLGRNTYTH